MAVADCKKTAVILFNMGGPDKISAVKPFLFNLFYDKAIIDLPNPFRFLLAKVISAKREEKAKKIYEQIGGCSPIVSETRNQAKKLEDFLNKPSEQVGEHSLVEHSSLGSSRRTVVRSGNEYKKESEQAGEHSLVEHSSLGSSRRTVVRSGNEYKKESEQINKNIYKIFVAMRYWHPFASEEMREVKKFNPDEMILLPLYPQFSITTSKSSIDDWKNEVKKAGINVPLKTVCCYPLEEDFIKAHVKKIKNCLDNSGDGAFPRILFSAHGLPKKIIAKGDPYQWQVEQTAKAIITELDMENIDWRVCYQSKVGSLEWLSPTINDEIILAAKENISLLIVPIAFVSEHSETLVELDIQYRKLAEENGLKKYFRVPALGIDEFFIKSLANICKSDIGDYSSGCGRKICPSDFKRCPLN